MERIIDKYEVVHANEVGKHIAKGYQPYGNPIVMENNAWQAMVTYKDVVFVHPGYLKLLVDRAMEEGKKIDPTVF